MTLYLIYQYALNVSDLCDTESLRELFTRFGFEMLVYDDMTAQDMRLKLRELGGRNFMSADALVSITTHYTEIIRHFGNILFASFRIDEMSRCP